MSRYESSSSLRGNCTSMCPKDEFIMRQKNDLIHILETDSLKSNWKTKLGCTANPKLVVKCFQRSAAGRDLCNPNYLRPPEILSLTVTHLLTSVVVDTRLPWYEVYNFISDRLRSVRQDLIIQRTPATEAVPLLESMVRFHIFAEYRLCQVPLSQFDPKLNCDQTMDCLKQILSFYDITDYEVNFQHRSEMEAVYQIINLGNVDALSRGLRLPQHIMNGELEAAMKLSLAWYCKQYVTVLKRFNTLGLLLQMAFALSLSDIRRYALKTMSAAYNSKTCSYPTAKLALLLSYDSESALKDDCVYYNVNADNHSVRFLKSSFDSSKQARRSKVVTICDAIRATSVPRLLLNAGNEC